MTSANETTASRPDAGPSRAYMSATSSFPLIALLGQAFLVFLPFSAFPRLGLFGNFDANLALYPFLLLVPLLFLNGMIPRMTLRRGAEGEILRAFLLVMIGAAIISILSGIALAMDNRDDYGIKPIPHGFTSAIAPLFLWVLFATMTAIGSSLSASRLQRALMAGFWLSVGYTALQFSTVFGHNPLYEALWPIIEGMRDFGGQSGFQIFHRLNGTTAEPAELGKLMFLLFLPWVLYPAWGTRSTMKLGLVFLIGLATLSIVSFLLVLMSVPLILAMRRTGGQSKAMIIVLIVVFLVVMTFTAPIADLFFSRIIDRISNIAFDPSSIIRAKYNLTALQLILEYPVFGIGWSNENFYFPARVADISYLWEVKRNLATGEAMTAKGLFLRLGMYLGIPLLLVFYLTPLVCIARTQVNRMAYDVERTRFAFMLFGVTTLYEGLITSFFLWAGPALCLGRQLATRTS